MAILIWSPKGGVGKSPLAATIANLYGYDVYTNDYSSFLNTVDGDVTLKEDLKLEDIASSESVIDLGGWTFKAVLSFVQKSDVFIIPCNKDKTAREKTEHLLQDLQKANPELLKKIIVVSTMIEGSDTKSYKTIKDIMLKYPVVFKRLNQTKLFDNCLEEGRSLKNELKNKIGFSKIGHQLQEIINEIESI
jgi:cellulose biosynthesis protein BcsQ